MSTESRVAAVLVALGGFATTWTAFQLGALESNSPFAWVPMGIYAALLVTQGSKHWPALLAGAALATALTGRSALLVVMGTLFTVVGPWLLARYFELRELDRALRRSTDVLRFGAATLVISAIPPTLVTALTLPTHAGTADLLRAWINWWLCSTIGIALLVPMALDFTRDAWRNVLQQRWLALALLILPLALVAAATSSIHVRWLSPAGFVLVVISAIRLGIAPTAIISSIMTMGAGFVMLSRGGAAAGLIDSTGVWAIGMTLSALTLTIHVLLTQWREAQQNLRAAEFAHRMQLLEAARAERERLSRDMHDALGQELTAVCLQAHSLVRNLGADRPDLVAEMRLLAQTADEAHRTAREIARGMAPRIMESDDIGLALRMLAERLTRASTSTIVVDAEPSPPLPGHVAETLYRVAQEALSNTLHHAEATRIEVRLRYDAAYCHLDVDDNGNGFDAAGAADGDGIGLRTMRYRCELAGGKLDIDSAPRAGTRIRVSLPLGLHAATPSPARIVPAGLDEAVPAQPTG